MPELHEVNLKEQLLRAAVAENVSVRRGEPRDAVIARQRRVRRSRRRILLLLAPLGLVVLVLGLLLLPTAEPQAAAITETTPLPLDIAATPASRPAPPPASFPAPTPFDSEVFPLAVRRIVVDPGHGGSDHGTTEGGLSEKTLTLDIGQRLRDRLVEVGFEVVMTRQSDRTVLLRERAQIANRLHADLFISIHINWIELREVRGVETYYLGPTDDPRLVALARRENRESGYSLADMRDLLERMYTDVRQDESRQLASRIHRSLYHSLRRRNPGLEDRGLKSAPFVVLVATEMPAILAEVSCLSNEEEAKLLSRPLYRDHIAEALFRGIQAYADDVNQIEEKGS